MHRIPLTAQYLSVSPSAQGSIDWNEFRSMFYRVRDDETGYEPRKLFNVVEFLMHDKNLNGSIDLDECMSLLYNRFGKVSRVPHRHAWFASSPCVIKHLNSLLSLPFAAAYRTGARGRSLCREWQL